MTTLQKPGTAPLGAPMMTAEEVTRYLRITHGKLKKLIKDGEIPAIRIGRDVRFRQHDIEAWVDANYISKPEDTLAQDKAA